MAVPYYVKSSGNNSSVRGSQNNQGTSGRVILDPATPAKGAASQPSNRFSADTFSRYENEYNTWKTTGKNSAGYSAWGNQNDYNIWKNIRDGKFKAAQVGGDIYFMDSDSYNRYSREYDNWSLTGKNSADYNTWANKNELDAFKYIRDDENGYGGLNNLKASLDDELAQAVADKYRSQWGDKYYYDVSNYDDILAMNAGQMPAYLRKKYKANDPIDQYLLEHNLPYSSLFNDMYSEAWNDRIERRQKEQAEAEERNAKRQSIHDLMLNDLKAYDDADYNLRKAMQEGTRFEDALATGEYDVLGEYYDKNYGKAKDDATGAEAYFSKKGEALDPIYEKAYEAFYTEGGELPEELWDHFKDSTWKAFLKKKRAWNESSYQDLMDYQDAQAAAAKLENDDRHADTFSFENLVPKSADEMEEAGYTIDGNFTMFKPIVIGGAGKAVVVNPIKPDGTIVPMSEIKQIREQFEKNTDGNFFERLFTAEPDLADMIVAEFDNKKDAQEYASEMDEAVTKAYGTDRDDFEERLNSVSENRSLGGGIGSYGEAHGEQIGAPIAKVGTAAEPDAVPEETLPGAPEEAIQKTREQELFEEIQDINEQIGKLRSRTSRGGSTARQRERIKELTERRKTLMEELQTVQAESRETAEAERNERLMQVDTSGELSKDNQQLGALEIDQAKAVQTVSRYTDSITPTDKITPIKRVKNLDKDNREFYAALTGQKYSVNKTRAGRVTLEPSTELSQYATESEIAVLNGIVESGESPNDYLDALKDVCQMRRFYATEDETRTQATLNPLETSLLSVPTNMMGAIEYPINALGAMTGDYNSIDVIDNSRFTNLTTGIRGTVSENIQKENSSDSIIPGVTAGQIYSFLYSTGMSTLDSAARFILGKGGLAVAGSSAANTELIEQLKKEKGNSMRRALVMSAIAGGAEVITEKFSLENLIKMSKGETVLSFGKALWEVAKQGLVEGSEETASELINLVADIVVNNGTDLLNDVEAARELHPDWTEKKLNAYVIANRFAVAGLGGFVSGVLMGGAAAPLTNARVSLQNDATSNAIDLTLQAVTDVTKNLADPETIAKMEGDMLSLALSDSLTVATNNIIDELRLNPKYMETDSGVQKIAQLSEFFAKEAADAATAQARADTKAAALQRTREAASRQVQDLFSRIQQKQQAASEAFANGNMELHGRLLEEAHGLVEQYKNFALPKYEADMRVADAKQSEIDLAEQQRKQGLEVRVSDLLTGMLDQMNQESAEAAAEAEAIATEAEQSQLYEEISRLNAEYEQAAAQGDTETMARVESDLNGWREAYGDDTIKSVIELMLEEGNNGENTDGSVRGSEAGAAPDAVPALQGERGTGDLDQRNGEGGLRGYPGEQGESSRVQEAVRRSAETAQRRANETGAGRVIGQIHNWTKERVGELKAAVASVNKDIRAVGRRIGLQEGDLTECAPDAVSEQTRNNIAAAEGYTGVDESYTYNLSDDAGIELDGITPGNKNSSFIRNMGGSIMEIFAKAHEDAHRVKAFRDAVHNILMSFDADVRNALFHNYAEINGVDLGGTTYDQAVAAKNGPAADLAEEFQCDVVGAYVLYMATEGSMDGWSRIGMEANSASFFVLQDVLNGQQRSADGTLFDEARGSIAPDGSAHSPEMQKIIADYNNSVNDKILALVTDYRNGIDTGKQWRIVSALSPEQIERIYELTGVDATGQSVAINKIGVNHIDMDHGPAGETDHSMRDANDVARMGYVIANADSIDIDDTSSGLPRKSMAFLNANGKHATNIAFKKRIDGRYYVVVAASDGQRGKMWVVSARIESANKSQRDLPDTTMPGMPTFGPSADNNTITQGGDNRNVVSEKSDRSQADYMVSPEEAEAPSGAFSLPETTDHTLMDDVINPVEYPEESAPKFSIRRSNQRNAEYDAAVKAGDTETASRLVQEAAEEAGYTVHAYHGTSRADRVGRIFDPGRATSGPMAFFTDSQEIAGNYARDKKDTSLNYDPEYASYETQFRAGDDNKSTALIDLWTKLPASSRNRIAANAEHVFQNDDGEIEFDQKHRGANGDFEYMKREARGNVFKALVENWLNSGQLWNEEGSFLDVLEQIGVPEELRKAGLGELIYRDPNATNEKVFDVYLAINNPFDATQDVTPDFIQGFLDWVANQPEGKFARESSNTDFWDKNNVSPELFAERMRNDLERGTTHAWTSIPDSMSAYLQELGYDGIKDKGGKGGGYGHTVWIPFRSAQVKSADPVTYDKSGNPIPLAERFNSGETDFNFSIRPPTGLTRDQRSQMFQWDRERLNEQYRRMSAEKRAAVIKQRQDMENRQSRNKSRKSIIESAAELRNWMTTPNPKEGKFVPDFLKDAVSGALQAIDLGSESREGGRAVQNWRQSMQNLANVLMLYQRHQDGSAQDARFEGTYLDLPENFAADFLDLANSIGEDGTNYLQDMDADQTKRLDVSLKILKSAIRNANRLQANSRYQSVAEAGVKGIQDMAGMKKKRQHSDNFFGRIAGAVDDLLNVEMRDAYSFGRSLGDAGSAIIKAIGDGFLKGTTHVREAQEAFTGMRERNGVSEKDIHKWSNTGRTFTLESGEKIGLSVAQVMDLYNFSKRPQAMQHILNGGIELAKNKFSKGSQNRAYKLTYADLDNMFSTLTESQKSFADDLQTYLSTTASGWGNEVSQTRYNIDQFGEEFYWPIKSARSNLATQDPEKTRAFNAIDNSGITKAVNPHANNPIMIGDCVDTFCNHVSQMANYNGMAIPIADAMKWFNFRGRNADGTVDFNSSIKRSVQDVMGKGGIDYFVNLIKDINGLSEGGTGTALPSVLVSNTKKAAVAGKLRVVIQQPTAVVRAMSMVNPVYFAGLDNARLGRVVREMHDNAPIAWWKSQGNYEIGTGKSIRDIISGDASALERAQNVAMAPAGLADDLGWAIIWNAVKREQKARTHLTGDALLKATAERFTDVINETQVIDTVMHRSQIMRSKDSLVKQGTAFMSEPIKTFNLMHNALNDAVNGKPGAKGRLAKTTVAVLASWALNAAVLALHDSLRDRDDDDELEELIAENFRDEMLSNVNPINSIPYLKDVASLLQGYDVDRMDLSNLSDMVTSLQRVWKAVKTGDTNYTDYGLMRGVFTSASNLLGLPLSGLLNSAEVVINAAEPGAIRTKKTKGWDKADSLIEEGIDKKAARGLMKSYNQSNNATKALSILTYDRDRDGVPDFDTEEQNLIAEVLGLSYSPEKDGTLEDWAVKSAQKYMAGKEKKLDNGEITEEQYDDYAAVFDDYFEMLGLNY